MFSLYCLNYPNKIPSGCYWVNFEKLPGTLQQVFKPPQSSGSPPLGKVRQLKCRLFEFWSENEVRFLLQVLKTHIPTHACTVFKRNLAKKILKTKLLELVLVELEKISWALANSLEECFISCSKQTDSPVWEDFLQKLFLQWSECSLPQQSFCV